jgi:cell division protein FtsQ
LITTQAPRPSSDRPVVDPRLRQRWVDTRREQGRRRLRLVAVLSVLVALAAGAFGVVHSPILRIRHVRVFGVTEAGLATVSSRSGLDREGLMVDVDPASLVRSVESIPWVGTARVVKHWPGTVDITVTHRVTVAEVAVSPGRPARGVALIDRTGRVLATDPGDPSNLPLLPSLRDPGVAGTPSIAGRISSIEVVGGQLQVEVGTTVALLGTTAALAEKMTSLRTILDEVNLSGITQVDLRVPDRPTLTRSASNH